MSDRVERRYLGGVRFVDVTSGAPVTAPLAVSCREARFFANRSGIHVIHAADALAAHADSFDAPPAQPAPGSVLLRATVVDRENGYLPRHFELRLPRDPSAGGPASLFEPIDVALYPTARAQGEHNWASVRAALRSAADPGLKLSGAFARVVRESDGQTLGRGMSELAFDPLRPGQTRPSWGELLVFVPGIPVTTWGDADEPALVHEVAVRLEVVFDPSADPIPDPDLLSTLPVPDENKWSFKLATGRTHTAGELQVVTS